MSEDRNSLRLEREYMTDRLTEISLELKRLGEESESLKDDLSKLHESDLRAGAIRRKRRYIARRLDILKEERETVRESRELMNRRIGLLDAHQQA